VGSEQPYINASMKVAIAFLKIYLRTLLCEEVTCFLFSVFHVPVNLCNICRRHTHTYIHTAVY
jgi:hypothetical protein